MAERFFTTVIFIIMLLAVASESHPTLANNDVDTNERISTYNYSYYPEADHTPFAIMPIATPVQNSLIFDTATKVKPRSNFTQKNEKLEDKILAQIPYGERIKTMWNFVDGDTDIYIKNLRVDKGNKGLKYNTNYIPLFGEVDGLDLEFMAGEDLEFAFDSTKVPLIGSVKGFKLSGSVKEDDSKIFARYIYKFD